MYCIVPLICMCCFFCIVILAEKIKLKEDVLKRGGEEDTMTLVVGERVFSLSVILLGPEGKDIPVLILTVIKQGIALSNIRLL